METVQHRYETISPWDMPPREILSARIIREPGEARAIVPGVECEVFPLCAGPFEVSVSTLMLEDLALQFGSSTPLLGFARVQPGMAALQVPLLHAETLALNGRTWGPRVLGAYGERAEMLRANVQDSAHAVLALPTAKVESLLGLTPASRLLRPGAAAYLQTGARAWDHGVGLLRSIIGTVGAAPGTFAMVEARRGLRDSVLEAVRILLDGAEVQALPRTARSAARRQQLVVAADDYLRAHVDRPLYTEELCSALGASPSALAEAFRATLAISPHRFLKLRRLSMVRAALCNREGPAPMVKAVALSHGFWHLSQFAKDYRALFGETPSDTLARARGGMPGNDAVTVALLALAG